MTSSQLSQTRGSSGSNGSRSLPLVAVAGAHGKTTVALLLTSMLEKAGRTVASWITSGVFVEQQRLPGEIAAWQRAVRAARVGEVDVLVQELQAQVSLAVGLAPRAYQLAIATNVCGPDPACARTDTAKREQAALEKLVSESLVPGAPVVANADDRIVLQMISEASARPVLFALHAGNPALRYHLDSGGSAVWIDDEWIFLTNGGRVEPIIQVAQVPATLGGALIPQVQNILAASAGARALGAGPEQIRESMREFRPQSGFLPAAYNILRTQNGGTVVVDSPRQLWSLRASLRGLRQLAPRQVLIAVGGLVELHESELIDAGRAIGSAASVVLLHSRERFADRHKLLTRGLGGSDNKPLVLPHHNPQSAVEVIRTRLSADDLGIVFVDRAADGGMMFKI